MSLLLPRKHRREPIELQLTAMIDIFAMLIIFLIKGTVFGAVEVVIPEGLFLPLSSSKETVEPAQQVVVHSDSVDLAFLGVKVPLAAFRDPGRAPGEFQRMQSSIQKHIAKLKPENKTAGLTFNLVADRNAPYEKVFDVMKVLRESGFQHVILMAAGVNEEK